MQIGDFEFDPASGELIRSSAEGERGVVRLAPQPARLLTLLASRRGEVVSHDEIRRELWPDVQVDFERGLHFCVRQVRDALDDSATAPRFLETLPRRGYRLREESSGRRESDGRSVARPGHRWSLLAVAGAALLLALVALRPALRGGAVARDGGGAPLRVAILPFRAPAELEDAEAHESIGEQLLVELDRRLGESVELIGPTSTGAWQGGDGSLLDLAGELGASYVVHGRYLPRDDPPRLLGELIRIPDGAHVWVEIFEPIPEAEEVVRRVAEGSARFLQALRDG